jgi:hypothetical protein
MKTRMNNVLDKPYDQDEFFDKRLVGLSERTKENYADEFNDWFVSTEMTPAEHIRKQMHDLTTEDMSEIVFDKSRACKEYLS